MKIVSVEWSDEVKGLVEEIFNREGFPEIFKGHTDDYILHLLIWTMQKLKEGGNDPFLEDMRRLAVHAYNRIHYGLQLEERPSRDDD